jgi:hypothetical protein
MGRGAQGHQGVSCEGPVVLLTLEQAAELENVLGIGGSLASCVSGFKALRQGVLDGWIVQQGAEHAIRDSGMS